MKIIEYISKDCPKCKYMESIIKSINIPINIYDIEKVEPFIISSFKIYNVPLIMILNNNGEELWRLSGIINKKDLQNEISKFKDK